MLMMHFKSAIEVIEQIRQAGFQAYVVGGAVRDLLLEQPVNDIDIATSATPEEIQALFPQVIPVGIEHGTVIVRYLKQSFEVTTFRVEEGYSDFRRPDRVKFVDSIRADLSRRDFTMNAIAMTAEGSFVDPFAGQEDLDNRLIRAVGEPVKRIKEDPLRMLRAIRFVSQLNFQLDELTWQGIKENIELVEKLSIERITVELEKLFSGQDLKKALDYCYEAKLFNYLPIFKDQPQLIDPLLLINRPLNHLIDVFSFLSLTTKGLPSINQWCQAYRLSNKEQRSGKLLIQLVQLYTQEQLTPWLVYQLPEALDNRFILVTELALNQSIDQKELDKIRTKLPIKSRKEIQFDGHDLQRLYPERGRGKWMSNDLANIERQIVDGQLTNDHQQIKEWIIACHPPMNN